MSYLTAHTNTEPPVIMTPDSLNSNVSTTQSEVKARVMGVILSIASCLIISTNLLVAAALLKLLLKKCNQSWLFVLNLALADTLVGVAITGLATEDFNGNSNNISHLIDYHPPNATSPAQGKIRCLMRMSFVTSPCTASILSMFLISLDRYAAIKMPLRYSQLSGKGTALGSLVALWICSLIMGFLPGKTVHVFQWLSWREKAHDFVKNYNSCVAESTKEKRQRKSSLSNKSLRLKVYHSRFSWW